MKKNFSYRGFTLVELLVVVAVIGIISAIIISSVGEAREKAKRAKASAALSGIGTEMLLFQDDFNTFEGGCADEDYGGKNMDSIEEMGFAVGCFDTQNNWSAEVNFGDETAFCADSNNFKGNSDGSVDADDDVCIPASNEEDEGGGEEEEPSLAVADYSLCATFVGSTLTLHDASGVVQDGTVSGAYALATSHCSNTEICPSGQFYKTGITHSTYYNNNTPYLSYTPSPNVPGRYNWRCASANHIPPHAICGIGTTIYPGTVPQYTYLGFLRNFTASETVASSSAMNSYCNTACENGWTTLSGHAVCQP